MSLLKEPPTPDKSRVPNDPLGFRARREALGWSQHELARRADVDYQRVQFLESTTPTGRVPHSQYRPQIERALEEGEAAAGNSGDRMAPPQLPGRLYVYALRYDRKTGEQEKSATVVGTLRRPESVDTIEEAFAVEIARSDMAPKYCPGDVLVFNPFGVPRPGVGVMVLSASEPFRAILGEFVQETVKGWDVRQYVPSPHIVSVDREIFPNIATVVAVYPG